MSKVCRSGQVFSIIDSRMGAYPAECIQKFVSLALRCCQEDTDARPSMAEVVRELESIWKMMPETGDTPSVSVETEPGSVSLETKPAKIAKQSSSVAAYLYISSGSSRRDLMSSEIPPITPR